MYAQDPDGGDYYNFYRTSKKAESSNERGGHKRSTEMTKCRLHICNLR